MDKASCGSGLSISLLCMLACRYLLPQLIKNHTQTNPSQPFCLELVGFTSKCMHGMNQTEAQYSGHGKRSQRATLSQIGPVVLEV